jgi:hypothetical protein
MLDVPEVLGDYYIDPIHPRAIGLEDNRVRIKLASTTGNY